MVKATALEDTYAPLSPCRNFRIIPSAKNENISVDLSFTKVKAQIRS